MKVFTSILKIPGQAFENDGVGAIKTFLRMNALDYIVFLGLTSNLPQVCGMETCLIWSAAYQRCFSFEKGSMEWEAFDLLEGIW